MNQLQKNQLTTKILTMPPEEWAALRAKISTATTMIKKIKGGEKDWKKLCIGINNRAWTRDRLFYAGFRFFLEGKIITDTKDFRNKKMIVLLPEEKS